ncbi:MAG: flavodoxin family protein [Clostridiaceae bacterium]|nr:flavodoxin family protein [Clostridiaceae bacterium]
MKDCKYVGRCAMRDKLTYVLERISACDALIFSSPIYFGDITGEIYQFSDYS